MPEMVLAATTPRDLATVIEDLRDAGIAGALYGGLSLPGNPCTRDSDIVPAVTYMPSKETVTIDVFGFLELRRTPDGGTEIFAEPHLHNGSRLLRRIGESIHCGYKKGYKTHPPPPYD